MPELTSAARPGRPVRLTSADTASSIADAITAMAELSPVRVTRMSVDPNSSTDDTIRVMAQLSPDPPQETQWWWSEQIGRRVTGLVGSTGPSRFTVHLDVPRDQLEAPARALRVAVDEADAAFASATRPTCTPATSSRGKDRNKNGAGSPTPRPFSTG